MEQTEEKKLIKALADKLLLDALANSEDGSWTIMLDDIKEHFDSTVNIESGILPQLAEELSERDEVSECIASEDCIQMCVLMYLNPDATPAELLSVIGYDPDIPEVLKKYSADTYENDHSEQSDEDEMSDEEETGLVIEQI